MKRFKSFSIIIHLYFFYFLGGTVISKKTEATILCKLLSWENEMNVVITSSLEMSLKNFEISLTQGQLFLLSNFITNISSRESSSKEIGSGILNFMPPIFRYNYTNLNCFLSHALGGSKNYPYPPHEQQNTFFFLSVFKYYLLLLYYYRL